MVIYYVILVEKVIFVDICLKLQIFSTTCSTTLIILKFYQYQEVHSLKQSKLAKFGGEIIFINGFMMSKSSDMTLKFNDIISPSCLCSVENVAMALKLSYLVVEINFFQIIIEQIVIHRSTAIYRCRITIYYVPWSETLFSFERVRLVSLPVQFQFHIMHL